MDVRRKVLTKKITRKSFVLTFAIDIGPFSPCPPVWGGGGLRRLCAYGWKRPGRCHADVLFDDWYSDGAVTSLVWSDQRVSISVRINLDDMLKNKMLMFDI